MKTQRKDLFNYAERLDKQLVAMFYNPAFGYVSDALYDLMQKNGIFTEHYGKKRIYFPGDEERKNDTEETAYVDLNTYNELMTAAQLFSLVGKTPREISLFTVGALNSSKIEYEIFTYSDLDKIGDSADGDDDEREYYYVWLYVGNNREIYMPAKVCCEDGTVVICLDEKIRSDYGHTEYMPKKTLNLARELDGYEYVSGMFDYLYDSTETFWLMKDFNNFLDDFSDEDTEATEFYGENNEEDEEVEEDDVDWEKQDSIFDEDENEEQVIAAM